MNRARHGRALKIGNYARTRRQTIKCVVYNNIFTGDRAKKPLSGQQHRPQVRGGLITHTALTRAPALHTRQRLHTCTTRQPTTRLACPRCAHPPGAASDTERGARRTTATPPSASNGTRAAALERSTTAHACPFDVELPLQHAKVMRGMLERSIKSRPLCKRKSPKRDAHLQACRSACFTPFRPVLHVDHDCNRGR